MLRGKSFDKFFFQRFAIKNVRKQKVEMSTHPLLDDCFNCVLDFKKVTKTDKFPKCRFLLFQRFLTFCNF